VDDRGQFHPVTLVMDAGFLSHFDVLAHSVTKQVLMGQ
jgi:hypothetical protein